MMLVLFVNTLASSNLFYHIHIVDGIKLVHSHFFSSESPDDVNHSHTESEFISIAKISSTQEAIVISALTIFMLILAYKAVSEMVRESHFYVLNVVVSLRGPPSLHI